MQNEEVMVVSNELLRKDGLITGNGVFTENISELYSIVNSSHAFMPRGEAEYSDRHKQVIPYVVVRHGDKYLLFKRKRRQTESRLHGKYSLGVGGHVNPPEFGTDDAIMAGLIKEFDEELALDGRSPPKLIGAIHDESVSVGKYHIGFLFTVCASSLRFSLPEPDKMSAEWVDEAELPAYYSRMERWSQLFVDYFV